MAIILILLAAIFKAVADTLQHHFSTSIFRNLNPNYWNPAIAWQYVKLIPIIKYRPDPWHLSNSAMILCFVGACSPNLFWFISLGVGFNLVFNIFYDKILRRW